MPSEDRVRSAEAALDAVWRSSSGPEALLRGVVDALPRLIPTRGVVLYRHGDGGRMVTLHGDLGDALVDADPDLFHPDNDPSHRVAGLLAPRPRVVDATGGVPRRLFRRSPAYREVYRPLGIDHIVCLWLDGRPRDGSGTLGVMLARGTDQGAFEPWHFDLLHTALPLMTLAARTCRDLPARVPFLALDGGGELNGVSPAAESYLCAFGLTPSGLTDHLRGPIRRWRDLRARHALGRRAVPTAMFELFERRGRVLFVEVTDRGSEVRMRLLGDDDVPRLTALRERHGLTAAELAVLQALALGLSNAEAADYLCVSVDTVKTHVRRLLAKLGLTSRLQAGLLMQRIAMEI